MEQWNLNKSIGWEQDKPENYIVLFLKLNDSIAASNEISDKDSLDKAILRKLHQEGVGGQAENDQETETDLHFVIPKNYDRGLEVISSVVNDRGYQDRVSFWRRDYDSLGSWTDQIILPK